MKKITLLLFLLFLSFISCSLRGMQLALAVMAQKQALSSVIIEQIAALAMQQLHEQTKPSAHVKQALNDQVETFYKHPKSQLILQKGDYLKLKNRFNELWAERYPQTAISAATVQRALWYLAMLSNKILVAAVLFEVVLRIIKQEVDDDTYFVQFLKSNKLFAQEYKDLTCNAINRILQLGQDAHDTQKLKKNLFELHDFRFEKGAFSRQFNTLLTALDNACLDRGGNFIGHIDTSIINKMIIEFFKSISSTQEEYASWLEKARMFGVTFEQENNISENIQEDFTNKWLSLDGSIVVANNKIDEIPETLIYFGRKPNGLKENKIAVLDEKELIPVNFLYTRSKNQSADQKESVGTFIMTPCEMPQQIEPSVIEKYEPIYNVQTSAESAWLAKCMQRLKDKTDIWLCCQELFNIDFVSTYDFLESELKNTKYWQKVQDRLVKLAHSEAFLKKLNSETRAHILKNAHLIESRRAISKKSNEILKKITKKEATQLDKKYILDVIEDAEKHELLKIQLHHDLGNKLFTFGIDIIKEQLRDFKANFRKYSESQIRNLALEIPKIAYVIPDLRTVLTTDTEFKKIYDLLKHMSDVYISKTFNLPISAISHIQNKYQLTSYELLKPAEYVEQAYIQNDLIHTLHNFSSIQLTSENEACITQTVHNLSKLTLNLNKEQKYNEARASIKLLNSLLTILKGAGSRLFSDGLDMLKGAIPGVGAYLLINTAVNALFPPLAIPYYLGMAYCACMGIKEITAKDIESIAKAFEQQDDYKLGQALAGLALDSVNARYMSTSMRNLHQMCKKQIDTTSFAQAFSKGVKDHSYMKTDAFVKQCAEWKNGWTVLKKKYDAKNLNQAREMYGHREICPETNVEKTLDGIEKICQALPNISTNAKEFFKLFAIPPQELDIVVEAYNKLKHLPDILTTSCPFFKLIRLNGNNKGALYEIKTAFKLVNNGEKVLGLNVMIDEREFDIMTDTKLIECKNWNWNLRDYRSDFGKQNAIAKQQGKVFMVESNTVIPEIDKIWLIAKGILFSENKQS